MVVYSLDGYDEIFLIDEFKVVICGNEKIYILESLGFNCCWEFEFDGGNILEDVIRIFDVVMEGIVIEV